jgi:hypothetical protein
MSKYINTLNGIKRHTQHIEIKTPHPNYQTSHKTYTKNSHHNTATTQTNPLHPLKNSLKTYGNLQEPVMAFGTHSSK